MGIKVHPPTVLAQMVPAGEPYCISMLLKTDVGILALAALTREPSVDSLRPQRLQ
jgi:hypothetical protein